MKRNGIPAAAILAGGISRHAYDARLAHAIDEAFAPLLALQSERIEHVGDGWSPAQHTKRASRD